MKWIHKFCNQYVDPKALTCRPTMGVQTKVGGAGNKGQDPGHQRNHECMEFLKIQYELICLILTGALYVMTGSLLGLTNTFTFSLSPTQFRVKKMKLTFVCIPTKISQSILRSLDVHVFFLVVTLFSNAWCASTKGRRQFSSLQSSGEGKWHGILEIIFLDEIYIFRKDGAGFPDFEDIDTVPSPSMWNQQLDEHLEWEMTIH